MPQSCDMGQTAFLPLRRKSCWGFCALKNPTAFSGFEPVNLGTRGQHANHWTTEAAYSWSYYASIARMRCKCFWWRFGKHLEGIYSVSMDGICKIMAWETRRKPRRTLSMKAIPVCRPKHLPFSFQNQIPESYSYANLLDVIRYYSS
jgi:hypothetical protein